MRGSTIDSVVKVYFEKLGAVVKISKYSIEVEENIFFT